MPGPAIPVRKFGSTKGERLRRILLRPFAQFSKLEASGGIILVLCAVVALVWANSPWAHLYFELWEMRIVLQIGTFVIDESLHHWINDGLMVIFFLVVGLEIKREMLVGQLSSMRQAILPLMAALGGMIFPALIYVAFNYGTDGVKGWGIPMATDIAFSLGVLAILGSRAPFALKVFLAAFAIADDIGAVLVIALFYTENINTTALLIAGVITALLIIVNYVGSRRLVVYSVLGVGLWLAFLKSGVHATIAGVVLAMTIPAWVRMRPEEFARESRDLVQQFEGDEDLTEGGEVRLSEERQSAIAALEHACEQAQMPLQRLENILHPAVTFLIVPVFAFANAGVSLGGDLIAKLFSPIALGIIAGLVVGKIVGVTLFSYIATSIGIAALPRHLTFRHLIGASGLGGIGFTMSLFIAGLAFGKTDALDIAKIGIMVGSFIAGCIGVLVLVKKKPRRPY